MWALDQALLLCTSCVGFQASCAIWIFAFYIRLNKCHWPRPGTDKSLLSSCEQVSWPISKRGRELVNICLLDKKLYTKRKPALDIHFYLPKERSLFVSWDFIVTFWE